MVERAARSSFVIFYVSQQFEQYVAYQGDSFRKNRQFFLCYRSTRLVMWFITFFNRVFLSSFVVSDDSTNALMGEMIARMG